MVLLYTPPHCEPSAHVMLQLALVLMCWARSAPSPAQHSPPNCIPKYLKCIARARLAHAPALATAGPVCSWVGGECVYRSWFMSRRRMHGMGRLGEGE